MTSSGWARPTGGRSRSAPGTHVRDHISGCAGADGCWGRSQAGTEDERGDGRGEDDGAHALNYVPYTTSSPAEHAPYFEPACPVPTGRLPCSPAHPGQWQASQTRTELPAPGQLAGTSRVKKAPIDAESAAEKARNMAGKPEKRQYLMNVPPAECRSNHPPPGAGSSRNAAPYGRSNITSSRYNGGPHVVPVGDGQQSC